MSNLDLSDLPVAPPSEREAKRRAWYDANVNVDTAERRLAVARMVAAKRKRQYMQAVGEGSLRLLQLLRFHTPDMAEVGLLLASGEAHPNYEPADSKVEASALSVVLGLGTSERPEYRDLISLLVAHGANVNEVPPAFRSSLLAIAIRRGLPHSAIALVEHGADALQPDENGYTPLHLAAHEGGVPELVEHLMAAGASADKGTNILPPPSLVAVEEQNAATWEAMMRNGGNPNATFALTGDNAATLAVSLNQPWPMLTAVVAWGVDLWRANEDGQTACDIADDVHIHAGHLDPIGDVGVFLRTFVGLGEAERAAVLGNVDALRAAVGEGKPLPQQFRWVLDAAPISPHCGPHTAELRALVLDVVKQVEGHSHLTHHLFGAHDRARVRAVLLVGHRLALAPTQLPPLPVELWHLVIARSMRPALPPASDELWLDAAGAHHYVEPSWSLIPEMVRRLVSIGLAEFVPCLVRAGLSSWAEIGALTGAALVGDLGFSHAEAVRFLGAVQAHTAF